MAKSKKEETQVEEAVETTETAEKAEKVEKPKVEIIRGRMPLPIVARIKNVDLKTEDGDSYIAARYHTTVGKINDLRMGRNFGYIGADFKPTQEQVDAAKLYAGQLEDKSILECFEGVDLATEADVAALQASRAAARKVKSGKTDEKPAEAPAETEAGVLADDAPAVELVDPDQSGDDLDDLMN